ncbi:MAG: amidohydrolase family protein, partial [Gaiellaceae bacterium]
MILDNGVVRTMDPALPVARALAIAGERVAGGVGTHETVLPTPEVVDLRGRCVVPGFTDSHVHFPTWSLGQRDLSLDGVASLAEALDRARDGTPRAGWIRGQGWRSADWEAQPTKEALDGVTGETPAALWAKDLHSLWLNSAALALAEGDLEVDGGVVERDDREEPTGVLREEAAWRFRERFPSVSEDEWLEVTRAGVRVANSRGVTAVHDKDGWIGAPEIFQRLQARDGLTLRVWQSLPWKKLPELESLGLRSRFGDEFLR